jgi:chorismate synthase
MSSVIGDKIKLCIFGESHGEAIGCVVDGLPAGFKIDTDKIYLDLLRRAPGRDSISTSRAEKDIPKIVSGLQGGVTTGAPLTAIIENTDVKSDSYKSIENIPRPSHGDYPAYIKYGDNYDYRGGGHLSGRLTAPLVFAGALAKQLLSERGVHIGAHLVRVGSVTDTSFDMLSVDEALISRLTDGGFPVIDENCERLMKEEIERCKAEGDSIGGEIECAAVGLPVGIGEPMFDSLESRLSHMLFSIPAVKGVSFGLGFSFTQKRASQVNDEYEIKDGKIALLSNNNGGIVGGMSTGAPLIFRVAIKPTPSISLPQRSVNLKTMRIETLTVSGRHDACIAPIAVPAIEAAAAFTLLDMIL